MKLRDLERRVPNSDQDLVSFLSISKSWRSVHSEQRSVRMKSNRSKTESHDPTSSIPSIFRSNRASDMDQMKSSSHPQPSENYWKSEFDLSCYFQPWFRLCYYAFLIPFNVVVSDENKYTVSTNRIQKLLCGIIHGFMCGGALFEIIKLSYGESRKDAAFLVGFLQNVSEATCGFVMLHTIWFNRDKVVLIFGEPGGGLAQNLKKMERRVTVAFLIVVVCFTTIGCFSWIVAFDFKRVELAVDFESYVSFAFAKSNTSSNHTNQMSTNFKIVRAIYIFARAYRWAFLDLLISLTLISAFLTMKLAKQFNQVLVKSGPTIEEESKLVFDFYYNFREMINRFNNVLGPMFIFLFVLIIAFCGVNVVNILESTNYIYSIMVVYYFCLAASTLVISAEAHYKASFFKTWLLNPRTGDLEILAMHIYMVEVENNSLALKGSRFFTITYSFLGTTCSVMLTYAIIIIQTDEKDTSHFKI